MRTSRIMVPLCLFITINLSAQSIENKRLIWHTDLMKAQEVSVATGKPLFAFFTGSDWCPWCKKLQRDVFSKLEFIQWAEKNVVLLELDFPGNKAQSPAQIEQNTTLQQVFQVRGYPTVWLFFLHKEENNTNYRIERLGSLGYPSGAEAGKEERKFLKEATAILQKKENMAK